MNRQGLYKALSAEGNPELSTLLPDGHFKFPHLWPVKLLHAGRVDYQVSALTAMRAAASSIRLVASASQDAVPNISAGATPFAVAA